MNGAAQHLPLVTALGISLKELQKNIASVVIVCVVAQDFGIDGK